MTRPLVLSNGSMHVGINSFGMVHDFYYPYVGLENHAMAQHLRWKIGIWVEDKFSWLDDGSWTFDFKYEPGTLIGLISAKNEALGTLLEIQSAVDCDYEAFMRNIHIVNLLDRPREIRLYLHHVMYISSSYAGDTAQYLPAEKAILHYKGHRAFVISGVNHLGQEFDQFSVGLYGIEGHEGTFKDAEDGQLSGNVVEHGKVDSVIGFSSQLSAHSSTRITYWVAAGYDQKAAIVVSNKIKTAGVNQRMQKTAAHWLRWLNKSAGHIAKVEPEFKKDLQRSMLILKSQIDSHGAVIASTDTEMLNYTRDSYAYCWPRDSAYTLWPLLRLGHLEEIKNYFQFCKRALQPEGYLLHKYQADGATGSSWQPYCVGSRIIPPIQEDETAITVFLIGQYYKITHDEKILAEMFDSFVRPCANFMSEYIDSATKLPHASYDLWEERFLTTTYTTAVTYAGLLAAAEMAEKLNRQADAVRWQAVADDIRVAAKEILVNKDKNYFYRGFVRDRPDDSTAGAKFDDTIDTASFYGAFMFGLFDLDSDEIKQAYQTLCQTFDIKEDGVTPMPRYEYDQYDIADPKSKGNPWFVTTLWIAQYQLEIGNTTKARQIIRWVCNHTLPSGVMSEQFNPHDYSPISVAPLTWSQAELVNSIIDLSASPLEEI